MFLQEETCCKHQIHPPPYIGKIAVSNHRNLYCTICKFKPFASVKGFEENCCLLAQVPNTRDNITLASFMLASVEKKAHLTTKIPLISTFNII
jgi:hypothetical protein